VAGRFPSASRRDEEVIDGVLGGLERRDGKRVYDRYTPDELVVLLAWVCVQVVQNGGLQFLFEHPMPRDEDYSRTIDAFDQIGAADAAGVLREAVSRIPSGAQPSDAHRRVAEFAGLPIDLRERLDHAMLVAIPEVARCLVEFIRARNLGSTEI